MSLPRTLIVGGNRGIGSVIRHRLFNEGHFVYTSSRNSENYDHHFKNELPDVDGIPNDLELDNLVFAHRYRGISATEDFQIMIQGVENLIHRLKRNFPSGGSIVLLGSNAGSFVLDEQPGSYHCIRSGIESLTRYIAVELGKFNIRCNCVIPATVVKPENKDFFLPDNEVRKLIEKITPLKRIGLADDIAGVVFLLCSSDAAFMTGQSIFVDGGLSLVGQESIARELSNLKHMENGR